MTKIQRFSEMNGCKLVQPDCAMLRSQTVRNLILPANKHFSLTYIQRGRLLAVGSRLDDCEWKITRTKPKAGVSVRISEVHEFPSLREREVVTHFLRK